MVPTKRLPSRKSKRRIRRMSMSTNVTGHFHPFLFTIMTLCAAAELGLTAFLISAGNANGTWPSPRYHALLIMFAFNSSWTLLFSTAYMLYLFDGATHFLANVASSVIWILLTSILWGTAAGIMHNTRTGTDCPNVPTISRCRQSLTVEALGWTEFGLCTVNVLVTCAWVYCSHPKIHPRASFLGDSRRMV
ncbi:hypothetical protein DFH05DRAFT_69280 [Lentinula detonsa]|uniref:MARVEL domain-containing protein n=1 Tax=Lentinula detonsa TaxID=2804962 RepID=A0A9W8PAP8_9AGAR|nr:hypothetical protein DFH05DRAFT_69280 [Lentinula detonsa]